MSQTINCTGTDDEKVMG